MLLADAKGDVLQQLGQHKGYRLVVTGHSLGGGEESCRPSDQEGMLRVNRALLNYGPWGVLCFSVYGSSKPLCFSCSTCMRTCRRPWVLKCISCVHHCAWRRRRGAEHDHACRRLLYHVYTCCTCFD